MSLLHYLDNEVPAFGEWDSVVTVGTGTVAQSTDAAFPERGAVGLRFNAPSLGNTCYVRKDFTPDGGMYVAGWFNIVSVDVGVAQGLLMAFRDSVGGFVASFKVDGSNNLIMQYNSGAGNPTVTVGTWTVGEWMYLVIYYLPGGGTGVVTVWKDGVQLHTVAGLNNAAVIPGRLRFGPYYVIGGGVEFSADETKIATTYPEPFVPTPTDEYPEARRTVVLFRKASSDSREFADYCVEKLEIPRCNLCPLPNATANESLADYATFQTEVEADLAAWLALNPTVAANCSCFLLGHGVPGYFTSGGVKHSAISRLMNYGTAFSSQTVNPLYNPATVARLTKTALGGKYLCTRIDADTLAHSKDILDAGLAVSDLTVLPGTDKLFSDETTYKASLACQHLRIITAALASYADDAFVWGDTGAPAFGSAGSRAVFADDSADSADTLRATSELFDAIITNSYAAGLGNSETADTFDAESFFEMLRLGGTLAEAFIVAIAKLDYTAAAIGSPLMTVAFQLGGYNKYRGTDVGGRASIDWDNPVAYLRAGVAEADIDQADNTDFWYGLTAVSDSGVESSKKRVLQCKIESGTLGGPQPNALIFARVEPDAGGKIKYQLQYAAAGAAGQATKIEFAECTGPGGAGADWGSPIDTITISGNAFISGMLAPTWADKQTVYLACRAVTAAGDGGEVMIPEGSPAVADTTGPEAGEYIEVTQSE